MLVPGLIHTYARAFTTDLEHSNRVIMLTIAVSITRFSCAHTRASTKSDDEFTIEEVFHQRRRNVWRGRDEEGTMNSVEQRRSAHLT
jgi:hypothetical protein